MKILHILFFFLFCGQVFAQEDKEVSVNSTVNEATVFIDGAQVTRKKAVTVNAGKSVLKFVGLSPFIDAKSIQVKAFGEVTVLSVNHQKNYVDKIEKSEEYKRLEKQYETIDEKIKLERTYLSIIKDELSFLRENRKIGGTNTGLSASNFQQASEFYSKNLMRLKLKEIEHSKAIAILDKQKSDVVNQISILSSKKEFPTGEVLVKVDASKTAKASFELTYLVSNAGWFPSYDVRAKSINDPLKLVYKANVRQDTKVDWDNVKLSFSSSNPHVSNIAPALKIHYLDYRSLPPTYGQLSSNTVSGRVSTSDDSSLPGVSVLVKGTTIGTITDFDGHYTLTLPHPGAELVFSLIGMESQTIRANRDVINVVLEESYEDLDEVVVVGYGTQSKDISQALQGMVSGVNVQKSSKPPKLEKMKVSKPIQMETVMNQTSLEFEIKKPYTIKSTNKSYAVEMVSHDVEAEYEYYCVPKIDKDAFLLAHIDKWEQYNLLEGEVSLFFQGTYVGKTLFDVRNASDTLQLSLGRDKNVSVQRKKVTDFEGKRFIGSKKEEVKAWETTIKNNKANPITLTLLDQVPVSTLDEIEVKVLDRSGGKLTENNGEVKWQFEIKPDQTKNVELKYSVEYPKNRSLAIE